MSSRHSAVTIAGRPVGPDHPAWIIAEIGVNHDGDSDKARALIRARHHVTPEDIEALAAPVLRHRIRPSFGAEARGVTSDEIIERLLKETRPK